MEEEIFNKTNEKLHHCEICSYSTKYAFNLKNHLKLEHIKEENVIVNHQIENDLACQFCTFSTKTQIKLDKHILTVHKYDQLHFCKFCEATCCIDHKLMLYKNQ